MPCSNMNRLMLITVTGLLLFNSLVILMIRLALGESLLVPLYLMGMMLFLLLPWLWHWRGWRGTPWVEATTYVVIFTISNTFLITETLGVLYALPFVGVVYRDWRLSTYTAALGIVAVWIVLFRDMAVTGLTPTVLGIANRSLLLLMFAVLYYMMITFLNRAEKTLVRARLTEQMAQQWAITIEARDPYTAGHTQRVSAYAILLAAQVPGMDVDLEAFCLACALHDVGKIAVSDTILNKTGPLTAEEFFTIQTHSTEGYLMVLRTGAPLEVALTVRHHHEHWDGTGYPDRLKGERIPLTARVLAVADAFDAMTSDRPYRRAMSTEQAYSAIVSAAGTQFDPRVVEAFQTIYPRWIELLLNDHKHDQTAD